MIIPIIFCLLLIIPNTSQDNCKDIVAYRSRDCVLSETDKRTYNYCCYKKDNYDVATCKPYTTEEEIQKEKEKLKSTESDLLYATINQLLLYLKLNGMDAKI